MRITLGRTEMAHLNLRYLMNENRYFGDDLRIIRPSWPRDNAKTYPEFRLLRILERMTDEGKSIFDPESSFYYYHGC